MKRIDLRIVFLLIIILLVVYVAIASYATPSPDNPGVLLTKAYQDEVNIIFPYDTLSVFQGEEIIINVAFYNKDYESDMFHIGLGCIDQQHPQKKTALAFSFPQYIKVPKGSVKVKPIALYIPKESDPTTYLCSLHLGHPDKGTDIAKKLFYTETISMRE